MTEQRMTKVSVEVRSGSARFRVSVQAESIRRALGLGAGRYPRGEVRLMFPVDPEGFFVSEPSVPTMAAGYERTYEVAA
jgi:hypothetical protein